MIEVAFKFLFSPQVYRFFLPFARTNNFMPKWLQNFRLKKIDNVLLIET